jgi:hypothetical protein
VVGFIIKPKTIFMLGYSPPSGYTLIPPPSWYPNYLPNFYRESTGAIRILPLNSVAKYAQSDILSVLIYWQMIVGDNMKDAGAKRNGVTVNWIAKNGIKSTDWIKSAFKADANGNGSGDWSRITDVVGYDAALYKELQQFYIYVNAVEMPWLKDMNAKGNGIHLQSIPMSTAQQIQRPEGYPAHLPSLFISAGEPYQQPKGTVQFRPQINWGENPYIPTTNDIAWSMLYLQPVVAALSKAPYPVNWQVNNEICGATVMGIAITQAYQSTLSDDAFYSLFAPTMVNYLIDGSLLDLPPQPNTNKLTNLITGTVASIIGKIPVIGQAWTAVKAVASAINPPDVIPDTTTAMVAAEALKITEEKQATAVATQSATTKKNIILIIIAIALAGLIAFAVIRKR